MTDRQSKPLARARGRLRKQLAHGWQRAVFAAPQRDGLERDEEVVMGPGSISDPAGFEAAFSELLHRAEAAAQAGRVKQVFVLDDRHRVELDARHGHIKQKVLDEATVAKVMGGKPRALRPDRSAGLLRAIGIMNPDGTISARNAKKYKQVNHLVELCRPFWAEREGTDRPLQIVDLACGNSYLGFVLLEALQVEGIAARLLGVDVREDVIASSRARADELGFSASARFITARLQELDRERLATELTQLDPAAERAPVDLALSLHACDTATDAALALAIAAGIEAILCVPCCQAELARQLDVRSPALQGLPAAAIEQGLLRRSLGELLTDALRIELLEACGYTVTTVEFVDSEHTPKNLLIRAQRRHRGKPVEPQRWRLEPTIERCKELGVEPSLLRMLVDLRARAKRES